MSTGIAKREQATLPEAVEQVLVGGDLSKLSTSERLKFYVARCEAANLDPRCRPFEYISLQGKLVLYAKKEAAEQLNGLHGISHAVQKIETDDKAKLVEVTVVATMGTRSTTDIGIVSIDGLKGVDLANARMKAATKAKRRATLSLCGLGDVIDETELDTVSTRAVKDNGEPLAIDNGTGVGSGKYASVPDTESYLARMESFLAEENAKWLDYWSGRFNGEIPDGVKDLCNRWQADNHLVKWAVETGRLKEGSLGEGGLKNNQIGRLTAIVYHSGKEGQGALARELRRYVAEQADRQMDRLKKQRPELFTDHPQEATDDDLDGLDDGMPKGGDA